MGIDTRIHLPANVQVGDVAKVIGILAGLPPVKTILEQCRRDDAWFVRVEGITVTGTLGVPEMASINLKGKLIDGQEVHNVFYHFEDSDDRGDWRLLMPRSTAFWIAMGRRLIDFFGGYMDYADYDDERVDYESPVKPWRENAPEDGAQWQAFQERVFNVIPLTKADIKACQQFAAYGRE
jgi:hypothetical protein